MTPKPKTKLTRAPKSNDSSFYNLELELHEDKAIHDYLEERDIKGKQFLRKLVRDFLKTRGAKPPSERDTTLL